MNIVSLDRKTITALAMAMVVPSSAYIAPATTGEYATGVYDFEFTDTYYPSDYAFDATGRRIMARAFYPACSKTNVTNDAEGSRFCYGAPLGRQRKYLEPGEWEAYFGGTPEPTNITDTFDLIHSYLNAPPMPGSFPVVIYTHGFGTWFSDNTALLEEIASHGYTVFAVNSPGYSAGVLFNTTGDVVTDLDYPEIFTATAYNPNVSDPFVTPHEDLQGRYDEMEDYLLNGGIPSVADRLRDDQLALVDFLQEVSLSESPVDESLKRIVGSRTGLDHIVYMGFSFGGGASASSAQVDARAVGAINLDGLHQSTDLLGRPLRTPFLNFFGNIGIVPFYYNEFFFEPLAAMGTNPDITRVQFREPGIEHMDFADLRHFDQAIREGLLGINATVDGEEVYDILSEFCLGFLDTVLKKQTWWDPHDSFALFPDAIEAVDLSYVAEWASEKPLTTIGLIDESDTIEDGWEPGTNATVAVGKQDPTGESEKKPLESSSSTKVLTSTRWTLIVAIGGFVLGNVV